MTSLAGKKALVTGAAQRLGRAMALALAEAGAEVVVHYHRSQEAATDLLNEIEAGSGRAQAVRADLSQAEEVVALWEQASQSRPVDILVNNASIFVSGSFQETDHSQWQQNQRLHVEGPLWLSQAFAKQKPSDGVRRIINMLDWRSLRPPAGHFAYTHSKVGLWALTQQLAIELAPHITVNGIAPGAILPPPGTSQQQAQKDIQRVPAQRWGQVEDIVKTFMFLATGPDYITGEVIHVDGGRHLL